MESIDLQYTKECMAGYKLIYFLLVLEGVGASWASRSRRLRFRCAGERCNVVRLVCLVL